MHTYYFDGPYVYEIRICNDCVLMHCVVLLMLCQSKYSRITLQSKVLQEDPSCQLLTVLRRYIHKVGVATVEESQHDDTLPQLWTVKKGILVLTRQWKNVLYMPNLANANFKVLFQSFKLCIDFRYIFF